MNLAARVVRAALRYPANVISKYRIGRAMLRLRPSYYPLAVIRSGARSKWPAEKRIRFITSFNDKMYLATGKRCVETFRRLNPDFEIVAYGEARDPKVVATMREETTRHRIGFVDVGAQPLLPQFFEIARDLIPQEYGGDASEDMFPPVTKTSTGGYFRRNMIRWFRKIVALDHATRDFEGVVTWMDCDCYALAPLPRDTLARAFGGAGVFYMKANRDMTEMGLVGFDLAQPGVRQLIEAMKSHYLRRDFVSLPNWDDCWTFDHVRARRGEPVCRDIGVWAGRDGHILRTTMLAPYLEHDKGAHGRGGQRLPYE